MHLNCKPLLYAALAALLPGTQTALAGSEPIRIRLVMHNDIPASEHERVKAEYLGPWHKEMQEVSGRTVELHVSKDVAELSDFDYRTGNRNVLLQYLSGSNAEFWRDQGDGRTHYRLDKTLLMVQDSVMPDDPARDEALGEAQQQGSAGWASLKSFATAGHELGHMFGATHENAEVLFNGWFCETFTYPMRQHLRSNCYRYSDRNREAIRAYLSEAP